MKRKSMTANGIYSLVAKVVAMLVPLFVYPYIMRVLGAESYGKVTYAESLISYFCLFATLGIDNYAQRECAVLRDNTNALRAKSSQVFAIGLIMSLLSFLLYVICLLFVPSMQEEKPLFLVFSLMIISQGLSMNWLYTAQERFDISSLREVVSKILYLIFCYLFIKNSGDYLLFAGIVVFTTAMFQMLWNIAGIIKGECGVIPRLKYASGFTECLAPIFFLALLTIGSKLFTDSDVVMIKWFTDVDSDRAVGLYNSAIILPKALDILLMAISAVITPQLFIAVRRRDENQVVYLMNKTSNALFLISIPAIITCLVFPNEILLLFAGSEYISAAPVLQIYSFIILGVLIITLAGTRTYIARQKEKKLFKILVLGAFLNICLNILLIKLLGIIGAAFATLAAYIIVMVIELTMEDTWHYVFTKDKIKYLIGGAEIALVFYVVKLVAELPAIYLLPIAISIAGVIYLISLLLLKESTIILVIDKVKTKFIK